MKKKIYFSLLLLIVTLSTLSQEEEQIDKKNKVTFGISAGVNFSFFNTAVSELGNNKSLGYNNFFRFGSHFNARLFYQLNDYFRLESGFSYTGKGEEYRKKNNDVIIISQGNSENAYYKTRFRLDYFEIPFVVGLNLKKLFKNVAYNTKPIFFNIGFSAAFNAKSDIRTNYYSPTGNLNRPIIDVEENFRETQFDFATPFIINFMTGFDFSHYKTKEGDFIIGVLFSQTLGDVYEQQNISNFKTSNSTFTFRIGFNFK